MLKNIILFAFAIMIAGLTACSRTEAPDSAPAASAKERLAQMSDWIANSTTLRIQTQEKYKWLDQNGQWLEADAEWTMTVWRPDAIHLKVRASGDKQADTELVYNGWTLAYQDHIKKVWAWAKVPSTIDEMLDEIAWRYELPIPASDMLYSYPYNSFMTEDTESRYVGEETINDRQCDHYAFSQPAVDWEIWIAKGDSPAPCRLDIIHKNIEGPPLVSISFTETALDIEPDKNLFEFDPPEGYSEIQVVENPPLENNTGEPVASSDAQEEGGHHE